MAFHARPKPPRKGIKPTGSKKREQEPRETQTPAQAPTNPRVPGKPPRS
jgi:hypothetical protein